MKILLDTCTFIWMIAAPENLSTQCRSKIESPESEVFLSVASVWEISLKRSLESLVFSQTFPSFEEVRANFSIQSLPVNEKEAERVRHLPIFHKDPFDRILIAQAIVHKMTILTPDSNIQQYSVDCYW